MLYEAKNSFSNSRFSLIKVKSKIYLRKIPLKFNDREYQSIKKQNNFKSYYINGFKVESAKINFVNKLKNNFYLVEFFEGKTGDQILLTGNKDEIKILNFFLNDYVSKRISKELVYRDKKLIKEKFKSIQKSKNFKKIKNSKEIIDMFNKLIKRKLYKFKNVECHGDLTLSNIIINKKLKKIILFDFLSNYDENIIQDLSKIFQEFNLFWTSRKLDSIGKLRSEIIYNSIISKNFWKQFDKKLTPSLKIEFLITVLRIVPYVKYDDHNTINWISKSIYNIKKFSIPK